jgi:glucose uptake protein GlcU
MSPELKGIVIGGLLPALLYGVTGILQKMSARAEGGAGMYLIFLGLGTVIVGAILHFVLPEPSISIRPACFALVAGLIFSLGAGLISVALINCQAAISQLTPLYNMCAHRGGAWLGDLRRVSSAAHALAACWDGAAYR